MRSRSRRALRFALVGFVIGYSALYGLFLADAMTTPYFVALYGADPPRGLLDWLRFQHAFESLYVLAGVVVASMAALASLASPRAAQIGMRLPPNDP